MHKLFCYGTLQVPQVIRAVTGRDHSGRKAVLRDYAIRRVQNAEYPGITYSAGSLAEGILYGNISDAELKALDLFEGELYDRQLVKVQVPDRTFEKAWVYVIARQHLGVLSQEIWRLADFLDNGLEPFMKGYVHTRRDVYVKSKASSSGPE